MLFFAALHPLLWPDFSISIRVRHTKELSSLLWQPGSNFNICTTGGFKCMDGQAKQAAVLLYVTAYWGTMNGLRAGRSSVRTPSQARDFSLLQNISTGSVVHPASYWNGTWVLFWVMRSGHEADYSPPPSAEVKDEWSYTSTSPLSFHSVDRYSLTFFFPHLNQRKSEKKLNFRDCWLLAVTTCISDRNIPIVFGGTYSRHLDDRRAMKCRYVCISVYASHPRSW